MRSKLSAITALTPSRLVPFAAQSRDEPVPYSLPATTIRGVLRRIYHCRVIDGHLLAGGAELGVAALLAAEHFVPDADVGEGAAHHDFVIAAPRAVGIEILRLDLVGDQVFPGGAVLLDRACGRNVIGGDGIAEHRESLRALDVMHAASAVANVGEVGRVRDIRGARRPFVRHARLGLHGLPFGGAFEDVGVAFLEHLGGERFFKQLAHFLLRRPDVFQEDRLAVLTVPSGSFDRSIFTDPASA